MTLQDKITPYVEDDHLGELLKITKDFAIEFANWASENYFNLNTYEKSNTLYEMLEIYLKEKSV